jgi:nucleoside-diphosphate-sugar epimerase
MKLLIVGCGYLGRRVALLARNSGWEVTALNRSGTVDPDLAAAGVVAQAADLDQPPDLNRLAAKDATVLYLAPPPERGITDPRVGAWCAFARGDQRPARLIYLGTTGIYGDCGGALVDESTPPHPATDRARRRLAAERELQGWSLETGVPLLILRVAGIYGQGRLPLAALRAGQPVVNGNEAPFSNRIHVDDLAAVCLAAAERGPAGAIYNVSDGESSTMTDYFLAVAAAFGLPAPPQISLAQAQQQLSPMLLSYLAESRRIDNRRLLAELGVTLRYPNLRSGLAACRAEAVAPD